MSLDLHTYKSHLRGSKLSEKLKIRTVCLEEVRELFAAAKRNNLRRRVIREVVRLYEAHGIVPDQFAHRGLEVQMCEDYENQCWVFLLDPEGQRTIDKAETCPQPWHYLVTATYRRLNDYVCLQYRIGHRKLKYPVAYHRPELTLDRSSSGGLNDAEVRMLLSELTSERWRRYLELKLAGATDRDIRKAEGWTRTDLAEIREGVGTKLREVFDAPIS